ncbi:MAG: PKD domain-containing protein [Bacteroidia bacterium]|nr:PKD domain-containing protein [Bacteroidia bacterium]
MKKIALSLSIASTLFACTKTPTPCFSIDRGKPTKVNEEIQFDASCSNNASTFSWEFGDGTTGTGVAVKHKYTVDKMYIVRLTATNKRKTADITQELIIIK